MIRIAGIISITLIAGVVLAMGIDLFVRGASGFFPGYLFSAPEDLGRAGGIGPMLASTALIVLVSTLIATGFSLPLAIVYTELITQRRFQRIVDAILDIGVGVPRIVWGLVGGVFVGGVLGFGFSVVTGVTTLTFLLAPILATGFISSLRAVDPALREQCDMLGVNRWTAAWRQVVPAARPGIVATISLAIGRGCGDAAALLFTAGVVTQLPQSIFDSSATLAVFIFQLLATVPGGQNAAYTAAAVLFAVTLAVQLCVSLSNRQERFSQF